MNFLFVLLGGCLACFPASARDGDDRQQPSAAILSSGGGYLVRWALINGALELETAKEETSMRSTNIATPKSYSHDTLFSAAIASAAKQDFIQTGIEATRKMLIECQQKTSVVLVMPSLRSDSQQAHCYRF